MDKPQKRPAGTPIWKWAIIGLVTACIVTLVALFPAFKAPSPPPVVDTKQNESHESTEGVGFGINYSGGWRMLTDAELKNLQGSFSFAVERVKKPDALIGVRIEPFGSAKIKLRDAAEQMDQTMPLRFKRFKKLSQANVRIKTGEEALRYEYSFLSKDRVSIHAVALIVSKKRHLYFVSALTGEKNHGKMKPRIEKVLRSFRVE